MANLEQAGMERPTAASGQGQAIPATVDKGYSRAAAVQALEDVGCDPYIAAGRQKHHEPEAEGSADPATATAQGQMAAKVRTPQGKAFYSRRKVMVAPVFGPSKDDRGFRRFLLRGLKTMRGEWSLGC